MPSENNFTVLKILKLFELFQWEICKFISFVYQERENAALQLMIDDYQVSVR